MSIYFWPFRKNKGLIVVLLSLSLLMIINELDETIVSGLESDFKRLIIVELLMLLVEDILYI